MVPKYGDHFFPFLSSHHFPFQYKGERQINRKHHFGFCFCSHMCHLIFCLCIKLFPNLEKGLFFEVFSDKCLVLVAVYSGFPQLFLLGRFSSIIKIDFLPSFFPFLGSKMVKSLPQPFLGQIALLFQLFSPRVVSQNYNQEEKIDFFLNAPIFSISHFQNVGQKTVQSIPHQPVSTEHQGKTSCFLFNYDLFF